MELFYIRFSLLSMGLFNFCLTVVILFPPGNGNIQVSADKSEKVLLGLFLADLLSPTVKPISENQHQRIGQVVGKHIDRQG